MYFVGGSPPYVVIHLTRLANRLFENCTIHNELGIATQKQWRPSFINPTQNFIFIKYFCTQANSVKGAKAEVHKTNVPCETGGTAAVETFPTLHANLSYLQAHW